MASMRMVSFVKNSYLEYDERDDEPKPYLGFFIKTTFIGVVLAGVVFLCGELMRRRCSLRPILRPRRCSRVLRARRW